MQKVFIIGFLLSIMSASPVRADDEAIGKVLEALENQYVEPVDMSRMVTVALKGLNEIDRNLMVADDNNRVSVYYKGRLLRSFGKPVDGKTPQWTAFCGTVTNYTTKISPVLKLKDFEITDAMINQLVGKLDGESKYYSAGHLADNSKLEHKLNFAARMDGKILYVRIGAFNKYTVVDMNKALQENLEAEAMILDLRGNSGGLLDQAVQTANMFVDGGIIFSSKGRKGEDDQFFMAEEGDRLNGKPIVVLVDGQTASSAEALSGSLQEQGRAQIVGTRSFGKGSVQSLIELPNGAELALTNAYLYLPSGQELKGKGIKPDYCLSGYNESFSGAQILKNKGDDLCAPESRLGRNLDIETAYELLKSKI